MKFSLISNTGPVLALSNAGHLELIRGLYDRIIVPEAVDTEIKQGGKSAHGLSDIWRRNGLKCSPRARLTL